jgi:IS5 family transposase
MHKYMTRTLKKRASKKPYISPSQLTLMSFETPFSEHLDTSNMWVRLAHVIPWDSIVNVYLNQLNKHATGASNINPRVILGALMVKHMQNISDEETIQMIRENVYIQYFLGFDSFTSKAPFDSSLFVEIRKRMGIEQLNRINDVIYQAAMVNRDAVAATSDSNCGDENNEDLMSKRED